MTVFDLTGRKALVTGGAQGLGEGMAQALAAAGAHVVVADVQDDLGPKVAEALGEGHGFVHLDVTDDASWAGAVADAAGQLGGLDIVVNNAGIEITSLFVDLDPDAVRRQLEVNLLGTSLGIKHAFLAMRPGGVAGNGGAVVNVASVAATIAFPGIGVYSATKSGVDRLTRVAAMEAGKLGYGVRVNCIYPGLVPTAMGAGLANDVAAIGLFPSPEEAVGAVIGLTPAGRLGEVVRHGRRRGVPRLGRRSASSPAPAWPSTAEWGCERDDRQASRRLRGLRLHRTAHLRVPARLPPAVRGRGPRQGQAARGDVQPRGRHRDRRLRGRGGRARRRRPGRAVLRRVGRLQHRRSVQQARPVVVEACLKAGVHYLDTTGEQDWLITCDEKYGADFAAAGLLLAPGVAQMYTTGEIAAQICLEQPGLDTLDIAVFWGGSPTIASTMTILANAATSAAHYLEQNTYREWDPELGLMTLVVPGQHELALALPWGGTSHPVWFKRDPRVANVRALGGVFNRALMLGVPQIVAGALEATKDMEPDEQYEALQATAAQVMNQMPPRENARVNKSLDSVHASGPLGRAHCVIHGNQNYKQTGLLQAYAAYSLLQQAPNRVGFASGCQAFGHRELLGVLRAYGLVMEPVLTVER